MGANIKTIQIVVRPRYIEDKRYFFEYVFPRYPAPKVPAMFARPIKEIEIAPNIEVDVIPKL